MDAAAFRALPSVDRLASELADLAPELAAALAREVLEDLRARLRAGATVADPAAAARDEARARLAALRAAPLPRVLNATGTVLHTGLGRAPLSARARAAAARAAADYCQLEFDLASGKRGQRQDHVAPLLRLLTGAEAALVVNNCAGATVLALQALAQHREVIVSRGELVEIGGSFRVPEIMASAGCQLREVGATNKTHPRDYRSAIGEHTALLLKVHRSNFEQAGFVAEVGTAELAELAAEHGLPLMVDQGSGCLFDLAPSGYRTAQVQAELKAGAGLVCCSGDKLLGGPQAGILLGRSELVERCARHPLARALRCDKVTLAALAATLQDYAFDDPRSAVPALRMLTADPATVRTRAEAVQAGIGGRGEVIAERGAVGSGALPTDGPATWCLAFDGAVAALHRRLRSGTPAVVGRIRDDRLLIDCATIGDHEVADLIARLREALDA